MIFVTRVPLPPISSSAVFLTFLFWFAGCSSPLGPGYVVQQQKIEVSFSPRPQPLLQITAEYRLQNTGNQPLDSLDVRMPGGRFHPVASQFLWDAVALSHNVSPDNPRDTELKFAELWTVGAYHALKISYDLASSAGNDAVIFSADAFYLPSQSWIPQLPQARGLFGFGGVPPKEWPILVTLPSEFLVHASGDARGRSGRGATVQYSFRQTSADHNPFLIAGKYIETRQTVAQDRIVHVWTRNQADAGKLTDSGASLGRTLATYETLFGAQAKSRLPLWIVECPVPAGCVARHETSYTALLYGNDASRSAELVSRDSVLVDPRVVGGTVETSAGPAFAAGWLGYGQNPGFYEQQPPVSALPAFAAALAREAESGAAVRFEIIQRALAAVPEPAPVASQADPAVVRAKSLLLFYALRDKVGPDAFQKAIQHMLYARQSRGFDVRDLIAALEEQSHQSVGPFVRQWIKGPGVPPEFRSRYTQSAGSQGLLYKP